jgi:aryl-alcohol dehydrogenase-like predicted oxidoreductase
MRAFQLLAVSMYSFARGFTSSFGIAISSKQSQEDSVSKLANARWGTDPELSRRDTWKTIAATGLVLPRVANANDMQDVPPESKVPTVRLGGGKSSLQVSRTIQGHWQLAGGHGRYNEVDAVSNMQAHYDAGITTLDTADIYGPSELILGRFLKTCPNALPCTKFCCFRGLEVSFKQCRWKSSSVFSFQSAGRTSPEKKFDRGSKRLVLSEQLCVCCLRCTLLIIYPSKSCERLQVQKLPLLQFFWSDYGVKRYVDVALWLTELKEEGLIQELGATNFDLKRLKELKDAGVPLVSHQVQLSALDRRPVQSGMAEWCAENDISLIAFGTVGSGILSKRYLGKAAPAAEELNTASLRMYSKTANRFGDWKLVQELLQTLDVIAKEVRASGRCAQATIANVAQRFILQTPAVASVLIGVRNQDHIAENLRTHSFMLNSDEVNTIEKVVAKRKGPKGDVWDIERGLIV